MNHRISTVRLAPAVGAALLMLSLPTSADGGGPCDFHMEVRNSFTLAGGWQFFTGTVGSGTLEAGKAAGITLDDGSSAIRSADRIGMHNELQVSARKGGTVAIGFANADKDGLGEAVALEGPYGAAPSPAAEAPEPKATAQDLPTEWYAGLRATTSPRRTGIPGSRGGADRARLRPAERHYHDTILDNGRLVTVILRQSERKALVR
jgi:hypothetical protein